MNNFTIKFGLQKAENRDPAAAKQSKTTVPMPKQLSSQHSSHYQSYVHISGFQILLCYYPFLLNILFTHKYLHSRHNNTYW